MRHRIAVHLSAAVALLSACRHSPPIDTSATAGVADWPAYGRDQGGSRYSPLTQITRENVGDLRVAWTYRTGDISSPRRAKPGARIRGEAAFEATPLVIDGTLYLCTPINRVIALDPETGAERWAYDPRIDPAATYANQALCRGVSTWLDPQRTAGQPCRRRILMGTNDARLIALDAASGKPCADFGTDGQVDLNVGIGKPRPGEYQVTSPPAIIHDLAVVGTAIGDNQRTDAPAGVVRAYDVRSGSLRWAWDPIPPPPAGSEGAPWPKDGYTLGTANAWAPLSADEALDLVFVPTGNASPDYFAASRKGSDYYSSSVVALRGSTGEVVWHFQTVHHDLWDYDVPAQPSLITVRRNGTAIPAVAQATKMGHLFLLDRATGQPLFPVEERPVPQTDVPGEITSPTQPFPTAPPPLLPQMLEAGDAWGLTPWDRGACRRRIEEMRSEGIFTPPSLKGSVMFPGNGGGTNWGGVAFDPQRRRLLVNQSSFAFAVGLIPRAEFDAFKAGHPDIEVSPQTGTPYGMWRYVLLSPIGIPCNSPPWGELIAIDADEGSIVWRVRLGTIRDLSPIPLPIRWGTPNLGGPLITAGGVVFIGAAMDNYIRAFDIDTGDEIWRERLPAGGQATPMTYRLREGGKQYVVIAAGGHARGRTTLGDHVIAYALP